MNTYSTSSVGIAPIDAGIGPKKSVIVEKSEQNKS